MALVALRDLAINMAILARPLIFSESERASNWLTVVDRSTFDSARQYVSPEESSCAPEIALRMRLSILLRTYSGDYHTDAFDVDRLAPLVRNGCERIAFWGGEEPISVLRNWIRTGAMPSSDECDTLDLGTGTVLNAAETHGHGYAEMCRTGSTCSTVPANAPILLELLALLGDSAAKTFNHYHTFFSVPRNRSSAAGIRGGSAIHRAHVREIGSSYWGVAPWYVMQGGYLEILDYRELYRHPEQVVEAFGAIPKLYCSTNSDRRFIVSLLQLNLTENGRFPDVEVIRSNEVPGLQCEMRGHVSPSLAPFNPLFIWPASKRVGVDLSVLDKQEVSQLYASLNVCVPLDDAGMVCYQAWLNNHSYLLSAVVPPKAFVRLASSKKDDHQGRVYGIWSKVRTGLKLATPYYLKHRGHTAVEGSILKHVSTLCNAWEAQQ